MLVNKLNVEDQVLPEDLEEATTLILRRNYCTEQLKRCLDLQDNKGGWHWAKDIGMISSDLKYLRFKKTDSERKMKIEKGN